MINEFDAILEKASYTDLQQMLVVLKRTLDSRTPIDCFEKYHVVHDDFVDEEFCNKLNKETLAIAENLPQPPPNSKSPLSIWYGPVEYKYSGRPSHLPQDFVKDSYLEQLIKRTNNEITGAESNSCLINIYRDSSIGIGAHSDDESVISQEHAICNLSVGVERESIIELKEPALTRTTRSSHAVSDINKRSHILKSGSLQVMSPGCQGELLHSIPRTAEGAGAGGLRISYSSRRVLIPGNADVDIKPVAHESRPVSKDWLKPYTPSMNKQPVCIVLGHSMVTGITAKTLGHQGVVNISKGGAKIAKIKDMFLQWVSENKDTPIEKIIVAAGANDIRYMAPRRIHTLRSQIEELVNSIREVSPSAIIYLQSQLPFKMRSVVCVENSIWKGRFLEYNDLLYQTCKRLGLYFMNISSFFLAVCGDGLIRPRYDLYSNNRWDNVHLNSYGKQVLLDKYKFVVNGGRRCFSPYVF